MHIARFWYQKWIILKFVPLISDLDSRLGSLTGVSKTQPICITILNDSKLVIARIGPYAI